MQASSRPLRNRESIADAIDQVRRDRESTWSKLLRERDAAAKKQRSATKADRAH
jgi:hypothetical protein